MSFQAREFLVSFINYEQNLSSISSKEFNLKNIQKLLSLIGNPQDQLKIVHVAGSKGKGSVCAMTASILYQAGYKVGLYTSPHLKDLMERIRVLGSKEGCGIFEDSISEEMFQSTVEKLKPFFEQVKGLTFFEVLTATALFYFVQEKVDFVVLETGLGGRLDATNVGLSKVCVITSIGLEHTNILGNTLSQIAEEKAAIIKNKSQKVVVAPQVGEVQNVVFQRCKDFGIEPVLVKNPSIPLCQRGEEFSFQIPLLGKHQKINAVTAIEVMKSLETLGFSVSDEDIQKGLKNIFWPGRFEIVSRKPLIILDCAHTLESVKLVIDTYCEVFGDKKVTLIFGLSDDKDKRAIGVELNRIANKIIATKVDHPRAVDFNAEELKDIFLTKESCYIQNVREALKSACENTLEEKAILVIGSVFLVGEVRRLCINTKD